MSRRAWIILVGVVVLLLGIEVAVRFAGSSRASVQIVNDGDAVIENLVVSFAGSQVAVGNVSPARSAQAWLSGAREGNADTLVHPGGKPDVRVPWSPDFDPRQMHRDGFKLVLEIRPNEVTKYMDDEDIVDAHRVAWETRISRLDRRRAGSARR